MSNRHRPLIFFVLILMLIVGRISAVDAQNRTIDSLNRLLKTYTVNDDKKATVLYELSANYIYTDPQKSLMYIDQLQSFENRIAAKNIVTSSYRLKGIIQYYLSDFPAAIKSMNQAYRMDVAYNIDNGVPSDLSGIAMIYLAQSNFPEALNYYLQASRLYSRLKGHELDETAVYSNIGIIYNEMKNYTKALEHFNKSLTIFKKLNNKQGEANAYSNIANVYFRQNNYTAALPYANRSLELSNTADDKIGIARETGNIGSYYSKLGNYDLALQYGAKAIELNKVLGNKKSTGYNLQNMAEAYLKKKDYQQAKLYGLASLKIGQELNIPEMQRDASEGLSKIYEARSMPDSALFYHKQFTLLKDSITNDQKSQELTRMGMQYDFDIKENNYKQQQTLSNEKLKQQQLALALNNEQLQRNVQLRYIQDVQLQNEKLRTKAKQRQLLASINNVKVLSQEQQLSKLRLNQLWLFGILSVVVLSSILLFLVNRYRIRQLRFKNTLQQQQAEQQSRELSYQHQLSESELKAIRAQMNPHFIFNVLNSIESYIMDNDRKTASRLVQKFAALSRLILENSTKSLVTADREWKALILYTELEEMRYENAFEYNFIVDDNVQLSTLLLPPMLVQPLIENAILHGLIVENRPDSMLEVKISSLNNNIIITVKDNGAGIDQAKKTTRLHSFKEKSLGITSIKERIEMINLQYEVKTASFDIGPATGGRGTIATITLPLLTTIKLKEAI